jgi:hypothetical protein
MLQALELQWSDPMGILRIQRRRHLQKPLQRWPVLDQLKAKGGHDLRLERTGVAVPVT